MTVRQSGAIHANKLSPTTVPEPFGLHDLRRSAATANAANMTQSELAATDCRMIEDAVASEVHWSTIAQFGWKQFRVRKAVADPIFHSIFSIVLTHSTDLGVRS